jgi:hypothetical protein
MVMCGVGIILFLNFSIQDFLSPGFIEKGIILENIPLQGVSSITGVMHVDEIGKQYVLVLSNNGSPTKFDVRINGLEGEVLHNAIFEKGTIRIIPDVKGDYQVNIKNLSGQSTSVSLSYGLVHDYDQVMLLMTALSVFLIICGNYLIFHKHFVNMFN